MTEPSKPNQYAFSSAFQKEVDEAIAHVEEKLSNTAPSEHGTVHLLFDVYFREGIRGEIKRKYEEAGWERVHFDSYYMRSDMAKELSRMWMTVKTK